MRRRYGNRRHFAKFSRHNGNADEAGNPTYETEGDWNPIAATWPCELLSTSGGETLRGRQVTAETSHVLFGEYFGVQSVKPTDRVDVAGNRLQVVAVLDADGLNMEMRIECRREV